MAKKTAAPAKPKSTKKAGASPGREKRLLRDLEAKSAASVKGGARRRLY